MRAAVLLLIVVLASACTRPRHGLYTAGAGVGVLVGTFAVGPAVADSRRERNS